MKLIIEIDEKTYNKFKKGITDIEGNLTVRKAVRNSKPLQAEFEKIKAEIKKMRSKQNCSCSDCLDIIDNHVKELKGEKKECSTCKSDNSHEDCLGCIEYGHWKLKGENQ